MQRLLHCPHCGEPILPLIEQAGLTPRLAEARDAIGAYIAEHGYSPTYAELCAMLGLSSKSKAVAFRMVGQLEERGHVRRFKGQSRSISLVECTA